jgi:hypothetical protein
MKGFCFRFLISTVVWKNRSGRCPKGTPQEIEYPLVTGSNLVEPVTRIAALRMEGRWVVLFGSDRLSYDENERTSPMMLPDSNSPQIADA